MSLMVVCIQVLLLADAVLADTLYTFLMPFGSLLLMDRQLPVALAATSCQLLAHTPGQTTTASICRTAGYLSWPVCMLFWPLMVCLSTDSFFDVLGCCSMTVCGFIGISRGLKALVRDALREDDTLYYEDLQ